jgi:hypothetical protein
MDEIITNNFRWLHNGHTAVLQQEVYREWDDSYYWMEVPTVYVSNRVTDT